MPGARLDDSNEPSLSKFQGVELLDAYVFGNFELGDKPLSVKLGNHVVNWGESLFIPGVNQYNVFDVPAARRPGAQVKEFLMPVQVSASLGLGNGVNLEAFYQFRWKKTNLDACGTYWSPADCLSSNGITNDPLNMPNRLGFSGAPPYPFSPLNANVSRDPDPKPGNGGQFGLAAKYFTSAIDTQLGAYFVRYHAHTGATACMANSAIRTRSPASTSSHTCTSRMT